MRKHITIILSFIIAQAYSASASNVDENVEISREDFLSAEPDHTTTINRLESLIESLCVYTYLAKLPLGAEIFNDGEREISLPFPVVLDYIHKERAAAKIRLDKNLLPQSNVLLNNYIMAKFKQMSVKLESLKKTDEFGVSELNDDDPYVSHIREEYVKRFVSMPLWETLFQK